MEEEPRREARVSQFDDFETAEQRLNVRSPPLPGGCDNGAFKLVGCVAAVKQQSESYGRRPP
jgi:hypothetical protein